MLLSNSSQNNGKGSAKNMLVTMPQSLAGLQRKAEAEAPPDQQAHRGPQEALRLPNLRPGIRRKNQAQSSPDECPPQEPTLQVQGRGVLRRFQ